MAAHARQCLVEKLEGRYDALIEKEISGLCLVLVERKLRGE